jgi:GTP-binding protein HflX
LFDRPQGGERAIVVYIYDKTQEHNKTPTHNLDFNSPESDSDNALQSPRLVNLLNEFKELASAAGAEVIGQVTGSRASPDAKYYAGTGKVEEIAELADTLEAELILFNNPLSPAQQRNLETKLKRRVLDRTGLILDIFALRARSHEGKLQVELAQHEHLATRLVRGWTHLERQKGGIGLRGPGETQLETDRRLLGARITTIKSRLDKVLRQRQESRKSRQKSKLPTVSLVGYTNAGKSTLFNRLSKADIYAADQLFATLDPTLRKIDLQSGEPVILADTVGFISDLPHELVAAFQSTLIETTEADLLLHVIDAADPERSQHIEDVDQVLAEIGAGEIIELRVYNKIDLLETFEPRIDYHAETQLPTAVWISAEKSLGIELLFEAISAHIGGLQIHGHIVLEANEGKLRAALYAANAVKAESVDELGDLHLELKTTETAIQHLLQDHTLDILRITKSESLTS